jgi:hypothetical protein
VNIKALHLARIRDTCYSNFMVFMKEQAQMLYISPDALGRLNAAHQPMIQPDPCFLVVGRPKSGKTQVGEALLRIWPQAKIIETNISREAVRPLMLPHREMFGCDMCFVTESKRDFISIQIVKSRWHSMPLKTFRLAWRR